MRSDDAGYQAYINSPEWAERRKLKFAQVGRHCQECGTTERLEVHHLTYDRFMNERLEDLQVLCHFCHMSEHGLPVHGVGPIAGPTTEDLAQRVREREESQTTVILGVLFEQYFEASADLYELADKRQRKHLRAANRHMRVLQRERALP